MHQTAHSLLWTLLALLPTPHLRESLKALLLLLLTGHGKARPQHSRTKSPSCLRKSVCPTGKATALSRFLNRYPWPTRTLIRLARQEAQEALHRARPKRGPKPRLLLVLDLVTLEKRGLFPTLPLSFFHGKWGLHLVVLYLVLGELRIPWAYRVWRGKEEKALSLLALRLLASLPPWMRKSFHLRVVADAAFGTARFLVGVRGLGLEAVVGMRRDREFIWGGGPKEDGGGASPLWAQAAGEPGAPAGTSLSRVGEQVPLSLTRGRVGVAVRGGHLSRGATDCAGVGAAAVYHRALFPDHEGGVFPGAFWAADGLGGASVSGVVLPGLPAGPLGEASSSRERSFLAGGWAGDGAPAATGGGLAGPHGRAGSFGSLAPACGGKGVFMQGIREVQVLSY